jgi:hypothetical protein
LDIMRKIVKEAIEVYNNKRPHYSNQMLTPNQMHSQSELQIRTYKRQKSSKSELTNA